jgi:hypothetical protein
VGQRELRCVRDNPDGRAAGDADDASRISHDGFRSDARQNAEYRQGYTKPDVDSSSEGPNDASTRQKHAFPS